MSRINNYEELVAERRRVEGKIVEQKLIIHQDMSDLKQKLEPFFNLLPVLNIFSGKRSNNSFLKGVTSLGIDLLAGPKLAKANWLIRLFVPMFLKRVSSRAIGESKEQQSV
jgi:hypothetical protein